MGARSNQWPAMTIGVAGIALAVAALAAAPAPRPRPTPPAATGIVARVGPLAITADEYEHRWQLAQREYHDRIGTEIAPEYLATARRQVLELLIRQRLLTLEAQRLGITGGPADAEAILRGDPRFQTDGHFDGAKWDALRTRQPAVFQRMMADVVATIGARKLSAQIETELRPDDRAVRAIDTRRLTAARVDYLPLIRASFDGSYPEPTESEVLAEYRRHAAEHMKPEEFRFTVITVDQPPLADSLAIRVDQREVWSRHMRQRAESLLVALRGGASFERLGPGFGSSRSVVLHRDDPRPAWWQGGDDELDPLFALAPGRYAAHAFPASSGWQLVRLDQRLPARPAPIAEVVTPIRERLRRDARAFRDDRAIEALYRSLGDQLRVPGNHVIYAVADTSTFPFRQPTETELHRFYDDHLTDYSGLAGDGDDNAGEVRTRSYAEVRFDIYRRIVNEERAGRMNAALDRVSEAWNAGRRDAAAERAVTRVTDAGLLPHGARVDTTLAGIALADSIGSESWGPGLHRFTFARGVGLAQLGPEVANLMPTIAQIRPALDQRLAAARTTEAERGAAQLFREHPEQFRQERVYFIGRLIVPLPFILDVPVSRDEVERQYREHLADYSSPEMVRVRQILIIPRDASAGAVAIAKARADSLMARVRAGEEFATLAQAASDDAASRDAGGDMGLIVRGQMLPDFEREAFRLEPGDVAGPIRTEVGFHILKGVEHVASEITPLKYCYANVAWSIAQTRVDQLAHARADSLRRQIHTPAQARAIGVHNGFLIVNDVHPRGDRVAAELVPFFHDLEAHHAGEVVDNPQLYRGIGYAIAWIDSIAEHRNPPYSEVQTRAVQLWNSGATDRVMDLKRAELDSLARAGWSLDSLGALYGGLLHQNLTGPGTALKNLAGPAILDSLVYGPLDHDPALAVGQPSDWVRFPGGYARLRVTERLTPEPYQVAQRAAETRSTMLERRLRQRFAEMAMRYPVRILDPGLASVNLPPLPPP